MALQIVTICFVSDYYPTLAYFGGIAVYTRQIARALAARGHEVHVVVAAGDEEADLDDGGVHLHMRRVKWLPLVGKSFPGLGESIGVARILRRLHKRHHFDIVEIPNWEGLGLASTWLHGFQLVIRLHTSLAETLDMGGKTPTQPQRFMIWAERLSARRAPAVVTHSLSHRERMAVSYRRNDIEMIPHGITIPEMHGPPTGTDILTIGRINARKGMDTLIDAVSNILAKFPDTVFRIVGPEEDHPQARRWKSERPELRQVHFLGMVDDQTLNRLYDDCAVYVSPAVYESFGLTFVEAMAHGRPVVGCATSSVPEIVRDGIDGILVPPKDPDALANAVLSLLSNPELSRKMGINGRQRAVEDFPVDLEAARAEAFFRRILEKAS